MNYNFDEDKKLPIGISVVGGGSVIAVGWNRQKNTFIKHRFVCV